MSVSHCSPKTSTPGLIASFPGATEAHYLRCSLTWWHSGEAGNLYPIQERKRTRVSCLALQALLRAQIEPRYNGIQKHTIGIIFMGTPHQGSNVASYGKILAKVATSVMNRPSSRLIKALQTNSDALVRLTSDFRFQLPNYQVVSFYETKPLKMFSTLVSSTRKIL